MLTRDRNAVFDTREAATAAGYADAEWGWWVPPNGDISKARYGWIGLVQS